MGSLVELVEMGERFRDVTPMLHPLFLDLSEVDPGVLESEGGFFGWVLELVQQRKARSSEFGQLLGRVVRHLETMSEAERLRWLELLSYIHALVYYGRNSEEVPRLQHTIEASVQTGEHRQEIFRMGKTYVDVIAIEERRKILLRHLRARFSEIPAEILRTVEATNDVDQLDVWLDRILIATTLDEMEIPPAR